MVWAVYSTGMLTGNMMPVTMATVKSSLPLGEVRPGRPWRPCRVAPAI